MVQLVGILNVTPDSFSDGGEFLDPEVAIARVEQLFKDGANLVDIGAESTRPNAQVLSDDEEWKRLEPILRNLIPSYPGKLSLDTYHPATVKKAWAIGPVIINDVTGFNNLEMIKLAADLHATVIVSHLPAGMTIQQAHILTPVQTVGQVKDDLLKKAAELIRAGLTHTQIILDPGIGFGKTPEVNKQLVGFGKLVPQYSVMIGYSRKRFLGDTRMELATNLEAGRIAVKQGAVYLRVHDVKGHSVLNES